MKDYEDNEESNFLSIIIGNFISKYLIIGNIKIKNKIRFEGVF